MCQSDGTWGVPDVMECERMDFRDIKAQVSLLSTTSQWAPHIYNCDRSLLVILPFQAEDIFSNQPVDMNAAIEIVQDVVIATKREGTGVSLFPRDLSTTNLVLTNVVDILLNGLEVEGGSMSFAEVH